MMWRIIDDDFDLGLFSLFLQSSELGTVGLLNLFHHDHNRDDEGDDDRTGGKIFF